MLTFHEFTFYFALVLFVQGRLRALRLLDDPRNMDWQTLLRARWEILSALMIWIVSVTIP